MAFILGYEGAVTLPSGHASTINTWSATVSRAVHDTTPFGQAHLTRRLGIMDIQGSCGGYLDSSSDPGFGAGAQAAGASGVAMTLQAQAGNTIAFLAVIDQIALSSTATGDATITFNFLMSDADGPTLAWS